MACGTGNFTRGFARTVGDEGLAVGIDVSETMLARAVADTTEAGLANAAYVRGDAQELPFRDRSFDAVCCFAAFHLFADPMRALDRMTAVLTPGGRIALFTTARNRSAPVRSAESILALRSGMRMFERRELVDALGRAATSRSASGSPASRSSWAARLAVDRVNAVRDVGRK